MAQGDLITPQQFYVDVQEALQDLEGGNFKGALITSAVTPSAADPDPRWGAGGGTNYSAAEVTPGGNYPAGGLAMVNNTVTLDGEGKGAWDSDNFSFAQDGANPTDARWLVIYNDDASKRVCKSVDLGAVIDLSAGALTVSPDAKGWHQLGKGTP